MNRPLAADHDGIDRLTPSACPFCGSSNVTTASEKVDQSTYWRCVPCGQMWNIERHELSKRYRYKGR
jgi:transcription elongation factor Elf1